MNNYSLSEAAIRDLDEISEYLARINPKAVSKLFDDIAIPILMRYKSYRFEAGGRRQGVGS